MSVFTQLYKVTAQSFRKGIEVTIPRTNRVSYLALLFSINYAVHILSNKYGTLASKRDKKRDNVIGRWYHLVFLQIFFASLLRFLVSSFDKNL